MAAHASRIANSALACLFSRSPRLARALGKVLHGQSSYVDEATRTEIESVLAINGFDRSIAEQVFRLRGAFVVDVMELQHAPAEFLARRQMHFSGLPLGDVKERHRHGGIVLGCANFGCFYHALLACKGVFDDILVVIGGPVPDGAQKLRERIESLSMARIRLVSASRHSGITIARQLAAGGVVATMLDTYLPTTDRLVAPFLGHPAASPAGIYQLVSRLQATIVPVFCLRRRQYAEIEIGSMIAGAGRDPVQIATEVNRCIGDKILAEPHQWMMWHALRERWAGGR